jgi:hypothetical protein
MACEVGVNHVSLARTSRKHRVSNTENAPVAQLDSAPPSEGGGHTFESCRARQVFKAFFAICHFWSAARVSNR